MLLGSVLLLFQVKEVQTWAAIKAASYLSAELKTKVAIKSLYIKPFKSVVMEGLYIEDLDKDTLLSAPKLTVEISLFSPLAERKIILHHILIEDAKFYLKSYKDTSTNLSFIIKYFNQAPVAKTKKSEPFRFTLSNVELKNIDLKYKNQLVKDTLINGVNYNDAYVTHLNANLQDLDFMNHLFKSKVDHLNFKEKSGFVLNNLTATLTVDTNKIVLENLFLKTPNSTLTDYFSMNFKDYSDFYKVENKVMMEGHFKNTKVYAKDIAIFAPQLNFKNLVLDVTGTIKGTVDDLRAKNLMVKAGKATYIKGNFHVKGLPDINNTFLDLDFDQVYSNKADVEYIIEKATGKKAANIPEELKKFGNVNFSGQFTGFPNDFIAYGNFKTKLGRIRSDVNMKISKKGIPSYSGKLQAFDFNLGELLDQPSLNRTSFIGNVDGKGFSLKSLTETLSAKASYFDYNNYRYTNITVDGKVDKQLFDGNLTVNDQNIKLDFKGKANLNPSLPEFKFIANLKGADLHKLNFTKDTIQIDADIRTNFTGNNLDNIQGDMAIQQIRLTNNLNSYIVDSLYLKAEGLGKTRLLALTSDIGDANIKGDYDLATLPSAFKTIIKKYIPSYQTKISPFKNQNFLFNFDLKNFNFVSNLLIPKLKIPERAAFNGHFDTKNNIATVNGFIESLNYDGINYSNIIVDESTSAKNLVATISLDKISFSNGELLLKNIVIQNTLKNDSLAFNVKLSDKDAINQLDLYGSVEFGNDTLAKISLYPSDVIIDNQIWKIRDLVKVRFDDKKVTIDGFELSNKNQLIAINGSISSSIDDQIEVVIQDLNMKSLSQITKNFGVNLAGNMSGTANLSAILGDPKIQSEITIDSLKYNNTNVGNLTLASTYNNFTNKIDVDAVLFNNNHKTMDIKGNVDIKSADDNLNLDLLLDKTELIIFEPAVKTLVTDLKGQVSADLKVTGKFTSPKINGNLNLLNSGFKVNYLQTAYTITDKVTVDNSVINIKGLTIKDQFDHTAIANGTVDLNVPNNPDININIQANRFMALNTTSKNNPLYFGKAFSTGNFKFAGPTDAMKITIKAKTEEGTEFTIPLNGASTISANDFIVYVAKDSSLNKKTEDAFFKGLTMEFNLSVEESSKVKILTEVGNLSGSGKAELDLKITTLGDFEMKGDYIIDQGKFDFTANNLINKTFDIRKGGNIRWTGSPTDAEINLNAVYSTRVSLLPLYGAAGRTVSDEERNSRVVAEAELLLKGSLLNPEINFNLNFPNNSNIKTTLQGYLDDKDNEAQQVINLVVRNSFNGNSSSGVGIDNQNSINQTLIGSGLELGFSKLNNIFSQSLNIKNLDLNVRSLSEFGVGYSILNGRLKFLGNIANNKYNSDLLNNSLFNSSFTELTRDFEINYDFDKKGAFVGKVFQRPANRDFFNLSSDLYINGLGLVFVQEYDTFKEFIKSSFGRKKEDAKSIPVNGTNINQNPVIAPKKEEE